MWGGMGEKFVFYFLDKAIEGLRAVNLALKRLLWQQGKEWMGKCGVESLEAGIYDRKFQ